MPPYHWETFTSVQGYTDSRVSSNCGRAITIIRDGLCKEYQWKGALGEEVERHVGNILGGGNICGLYFSLQCLLVLGPTITTHSEFPTVWDSSHSYTVPEEIFLLIILEY